MRGSIRRSLIASAFCIAFLSMAAGPAVAQVGTDVERLYTGVTPPAQGNALAPGGVVTPAGVPAVTGPSTALGAVSRPTAGAVLGGAGQPQVLPLRVSGGGVAGGSRAPVSALAFTGADVVSLVLIGFAAMSLGVVLTRRARPRSAAKP